MQSTQVADMVTRVLRAVYLMCAPFPCLSTAPGPHAESVKQ